MQPVDLGKPPTDPVAFSYGPDTRTGSAEAALGKQFSCNASPVFNHA